MKRKWVLFAIAVLAIIAGVVIFFIPVITYSLPEPDKLVEEQTLEVDEGKFYRTEITRLPAAFGITENLTKLGIAIEPFMLEFGVLPPNISAKKLIEVSNKEETAVKVEIKSYGNITKFLTADTGNEFILDGKQNRTIKIKAEGEEIGTYRGEVQIVIKRPTNKWGEWLLSFV